jgi:hypothetical protein
MVGINEFGVQVDYETFRRAINERIVEYQAQLDEKWEKHKNDPMVIRLLAEGVERPKPRVKFDYIPEAPGFVLRHHEQEGCPIVEDLVNEKVFAIYFFVEESADAEADRVIPHIVNYINDFYFGSRQSVLRKLGLIPVSK